MKIFRINPKTRPESERGWPDDQQILDALPRVSHLPHYHESILAVARSGRNRLASTSSSSFLLTNAFLLYQRPFYRKTGIQSPLAKGWNERHMLSGDQALAMGPAGRICCDSYPGPWFRVVRSCALSGETRSSSSGQPMKR
jgi:hypothetical protein